MSAPPAAKPVSGPRQGSQGAVPPAAVPANGTPGSSALPANGGGSRPGSQRGSATSQGKVPVPAAAVPAAPVPAAATPVDPAIPPPLGPPTSVPTDPKIDGLLQRILASKGKPAKGGIKVIMKEDDIRHLNAQVREVLLRQPSLIEIEGPVKICGDVHGQFDDLLRIFEKAGFPPESNYLFLGDYVDRGKHSLETIALLFCYKWKYAENFFLLRGNHESASVNRMYGFFDDCKRRCNVKLWKSFTDVFNCLPVCGLVADKIICMHGGISPDLDDLQLIRNIRRPVDVPDAGILCDLLWADPEPDLEGWAESDRGVSYLFGADEVDRFLNLMDMDLIVRAHQVMERGYEFFADRQLVTIFSAPNYCGEFENDAALMNITEELQCSFTIVPCVPTGPKSLL
eukprot:TRINITY_DN27167_c2_g2_i1.p1 TRINITY_DN27167_c2_g2~~TRINITY_DN27167_c2_g2_i1.p1  ORF type:complete len:451 (+),score=101.93 TRINITY_DN27167_c2_g2_i1:159-1355(+)